FEIGVTIVRVARFHALAENGMGLVEKQQRVGEVGGVEEALEIFLRFANVLADDLREVDAVHRQVEFAGEDFRRHGFAGPRRSGEEDGNATLVPETRRSPAVMDFSKRAHGLENFSEGLTLALRQEELGRTVETGDHGGSEVAHVGGTRYAAGGCQGGAGDRLRTVAQRGSDLLNGLLLVAEATCCLRDRTGGYHRTQRVSPQLGAFHKSHGGHFGWGKLDLAWNAFERGAIDDLDEQVQRKADTGGHGIGKFARYAGRRQQIAALQPAERDCDWQRCGCGLAIQTSPGSAALPRHA